MEDIPLTTQVLRQAYAQGFFPMPSETGKLFWYHPDPRAIIPLDKFHCSRSLRRTLNRKTYTVTFDRDFAAVMRGCADRQDTWINDDFLRAYTQLHAEGNAHSVEVWRGDELVGGVYGVAFGAAFFAESKFHKATDASKVALYHLVEHLRTKGFELLEVQFLTTHLESLGAIAVSAQSYMSMLHLALGKDAEF